MKASITTLSSWTGLDRRTVQKRLEGLDFVNNGTAGHHYESTEALRRIYLGEPAATGENLDPQQEKAALDAARRRLAELDYQKRTGELIAADVVQETWIRMAGACRSKLLTLPGRLAVSVTGCSTVHETEQVAKDLVHEALAELAANGKPQ
jgi:phage terminase Nu1 subunit (DNA packaging protein)